VQALGTSATADPPRALAGGLDHPEAVVWDPRGGLYAGGEAGQLYAVTLDGVVSEVANTGGAPLGLALDAGGRLHVCDEGLAAVLVCDPGSGTVELRSSGTPDGAMELPNYACFDAAGNLYVTDSGRWGAHDGRIYRIDRDGNTEVWSTDPCSFPNGCCLAKDGRSLLVVESELPGITAIEIEPDGSAGRLSAYAHLEGTVPDGIALDASGAAYVGCYRPDRIVRIPAGEAPEVFVDDPGGMTICVPTNVAFAGPDRRLLVASLFGAHELLAWDVEVPGLELPYPEIPGV
jgi:gluconolactonase